MPDLSKHHAFDSLSNRGLNRKDVGVVLLQLGKGLGRVNQVVDHGLCELLVGFVLEGGNRPNVVEARLVELAEEGVHEI